MSKRNKPIYPKRIWTIEDKMFLRQNYTSKPMPEIMAFLQRTDEAIHCMASNLGITGQRYPVNNYLAGKSYKNKDKAVSTKQPVKREPATATRGRKKKGKSHRWCDQKLAAKPFTTEGKKTVKVDHKTTIYVPADASESEIEIIVSRYKKAI